MRPIVTDGVELSVCQSVTIVNPAKTAEMIEMPFGLWTRVGPRNHVLDGESRSSMRRGNFEGKGADHGKYRDSTVSCAKTAEPIEMPFGVWTRVCSRKHLLDGGAVHIGAT